MSVCLASIYLPDPGIEATSPVSPALAGRTFPAETPGKLRVPCMAQEQMWSPVACQSMPFPKRRQALHPRVHLSSQEKVVGKAAGFSLRAPSMDPRGHSGGPHRALHVCAYLLGQGSLRCGVGPRKGLWWGWVISWGGGADEGPGQFPTVRDQDKVPEGNGVPGVLPTPDSQTGEGPWSGGHLVDTPTDRGSERLGQQGGAPWGPPTPSLTHHSPPSHLHP